MPNETRQGITVTHSSFTVLLSFTYHLSAFSTLTGKQRVSHLQNVEKLGQKIIHHYLRIMTISPCKYNMTMSQFL